jgi:predicted XRE-type DNA-binding protein
MASSASKAVIRKIHAGMVDLESGELLEGMPMIDRQKAKHYWEATFVVTFQDAVRAIAKSKLSGESLRVLMYLLGTLQMNNEWKILSQREIAEELKMQRPNVSRALRDLAQNSIITKGARIGKGHAYTLNPYLGWRGPFKNHAPAKNKAAPLTLLKGGRKEIVNEIADKIAA